MSIVISLIFTIFTSVIPTENQTTLSEAEGEVEWRDGGCATLPAVPLPRRWVSILFAEAGSCFSASAKRWDSIHYSSKRFGSRHKCQGTTSVVPSNPAKRFFPCAAGSRAAAPSRPGVWLAGTQRSGARTKKSHCSYRRTHPFAVLRKPSCAM